MKFKKYLKELNRLAKDRPEILEFETIAAKDAEGNGFNIVHYTPTVGYFDGQYNGDFESEEDSEETANSICIN
jgi:hypothetical protein